MNENVQIKCIRLCSIETILFLSKTYNAEFV